MLKIQSVDTRNPEKCRTEMAKLCGCALLSAILLLFCMVEMTLAANEDQMISFPYGGKECTCKLLSCACCQGFRVNPLNFEKNLCLEFKLSIFPIKADIKIKMDNSTVAEFSVDPKNPPKYCIPILLPVPVAICVKLNDVKLVGLTAMQMCATFFVNFQTDQVFEHKFPCVKLTTSGVEMMARR